MTASFDDLDLPALVCFLTEDEQRDLRPLVLRFIACREPSAERGRTTPRTVR
ncbi:hypothetical protein ACIBCD_10860 [Nocardia brasiliensis]|uniref:hypothetical protein n=1 Tax=Nocardia brasiliensis TaxID=37326 RepID=UPI0037923786